MKTFVKKFMEQFLFDFHTCDVVIAKDLNTIISDKPLISSICTKRTKKCFG